MSWVHVIHFPTGVDSVQVRVGPSYLLGFCYVCAPRFSSCSAHDYTNIYVLREAPPDFPGCDGACLFFFRGPGRRRCSACSASTPTLSRSYPKLTVPADSCRRIRQGETRKSLLALHIVTAARVAQAKCLTIYQT